MGARSKRSERCSRCKMHVGLCVCDLIEPIDTRTRVDLLMHHREDHKPTNTGRVAPLALRNARVLVRGELDQPDPIDQLDDGSHQLWLLFPDETAEVITPALVAVDPRPVALIVPDGNWGQARRAARRVMQRHPAARAVVLPPMGPTRYHLRHEHVEGGLGTGEAVARALGLIEGPAVEAHMMRLFDAIVDRVLATRGQQRPE